MQRGIATVGSWRLGPTPGAQTLLATATGTHWQSGIFRGDRGRAGREQHRGICRKQSDARPNFIVTIPPSVIVTDPAGVPVPGVAVTFAVTAGGGTLTGEAATTNARWNRRSWQAGRLAPRRDQTR